MILHYRERDIPLLVAEIASLKKTVAELRAQVTLSLEKQRLMASLIDRFCEWIDARPQLSNSAIWKVYRDSVALASPPAAGDAT